MIRNTVATLEAESGFTLESTAVTEFRTGVLAGRWDTVEKLLLDLPQDDAIDLVVRMSSNDYGTMTELVSQTVKFSIRQQKFLEALEAKDTKKALSILRHELAPLNHDSDRLHLLSRCGHFLLPCEQMT